MIKALVLGGAANVWQDAEAARLLFKPDLVIAVNTIGTVWTGQFDVWCSYHCGLLRTWRILRERNGLEPAKEHWTCAPNVPLDKDVQVFRMPDGKLLGGSSGLVATYIALLEKKATHVVLAGVPMEPSGAHWDDKKRKEWADALPFRKHWEHRKNQLIHVRSLSGWTRDLLGEPTKEWLEIE